MGRCREKQYPVSCTVHMREESKKMLHIYCGEGKGKTTAAIGLAIRFAGTGSVLFCQFLKGEAAGERAVLKKIPGITVPKVPEKVPFFKTLKETEKKDWICYYRRQWERYQGLMEQGNYGLVVLDEILPAIGHGIVSEEEILAFAGKYHNSELVLTGRYAPASLFHAADYISVIQKEKHPFDLGIRARQGIEY